MTKAASVLKIAMSLIALFLLGTAGAAMDGKVGIGTQGISLLQAMAGTLLVFGFTPMVVSQAVGKALSAISLVVSLALGSHWAFLDTLAATHHGVVIALHVVGFANAVVAFIAHNAPPAVAAAPDGPLPKV